MKQHAHDGPPVLDAAEYLDRLGLREPLRLAVPRTAAYQDACHLAHAQQVTAAPRRLLQRVEGLTVVPLADEGMCCGSAGLYNIDQPALAADLGARKAAAIAASGATLAITGNIGCLTQLDAALAAAGHDVQVCHTMELLAGALVGASSTGVERH
jgi:glycolate oxidase iron-sulfur subunit